MANKQNAPRFDATAIYAKRNKVKGVKVSSRDRATDSAGSEDHVRETSPPPKSPKWPRTESGIAMGEVGSSTTPIPDTSDIPHPALPLIESSYHPPPSPSLVCSDASNPLLKEASRFIMKFDGNARTPITSIYDRCFLNEVFIDQNLSLPTDKEKHEKIGLPGLLRIQQAVALTSASISHHIERDTGHDQSTRHFQGPTPGGLEEIKG